jgi:phage shock protein C
MAERKPSKKRAKKAASKKRHVLEKRAEHFGREVETLGKRLERKGDEWDTWFHRTFGPVGPIISSIFGIVILGLLVWILGIVNIPIGSSFLGRMESFLFNNMGLFFMIFLFFSFTSYLSRAYPRAYFPFSPITLAAGITIAFWLASEAISIANLSMGIIFISSTVVFIQANLAGLFAFFLILAYITFAIRVALMDSHEFKEAIMEKQKTMSRKAPRPSKGGPKRLYRSGRDKILGGVCGGIGEYLGVDPVIIRLIWVISFLAWGSGLIAYIIAWIIIPRNPRHRWED